MARRRTPKPRPQKRGFLLLQTLVGWLAMAASHCPPCEGFLFPEVAVHFYVLRDLGTPRSTPGRMYLQQDTGDVFIGHTLEDVVRAGPKVDGRTAIPAGTYTLSVTHSNRFKKPLPLLSGVPGFSGIRIHGGNTSADTEGCILVGRTRFNADKIGLCAPIVDLVIQYLNAAAARHEPATITIRECPV